MRICGPCMGFSLGFSQAELPKRGQIPFAADCHGRTSSRGRLRGVLAHALSAVMAGLDPAIHDEVQQ